MIGMEVNSPTLSIWALSLMGLGLAEGIEVLAGTPYVAAEVEAMASVTVSTPLKKPSLGVAMATKISSVVG